MIDPGSIRDAVCVFVMGVAVVALLASLKLYLWITKPLRET